MKVKEIIELSAELLGIKLMDENIETLLHCYNLVENELAVDYFPLLAMDKVYIKENKIKYIDLKKQVRRILKVQDYQNDEVKYNILPEYLELAKNYNGHLFFVKYHYIPEEKTIEDNCEYDNRMKQALKYGVCAEHCIMQGDFQSASIFDDKYKSEIKERYSYKEKK